MTSHLPQVTEPSAWTASDLVDDNSWDFELSRMQCDELLDATYKSTIESLLAIAAHAPALPQCEPVLSGIRDSVRSGRGFALLHRSPVEALARHEI